MNNRVEKRQKIPEIGFLHHEAELYIADISSSYCKVIRIRLDWIEQLLYKT